MQVVTGYDLISDDDVYRSMQIKQHKPSFKEQFIQEYSEGFDAEWVENFIRVCNHHPRKAIRVNTTKITVENLKKQLHEDWKLTSVPWCDEGFWIENTEEDRFDVGNLYSHLVGHLYVQSAASMIPPVVLDVKPGMTVLDMCAAPGSKTTQIAQYMEDKGIIIANDSDGNRLKALGINQQRLGLQSILVTNMNGEDIPAEQKFDRILVDAPCSGSGTVMKSHRAAEMWSESLISRMVGIQNVLIRKAWSLLKPGGIMVYSTCSVQPEENEGVVSDFLAEADARLLFIFLDIQSTPPVTEWKDSTYEGVAKTLRISPQDNWTEGFYVAKIAKPGRQ